MELLNPGFLNLGLLKSEFIKFESIKFGLLKSWIVTFRDFLIQTLLN